MLRSKPALVFLGLVLGGCADDISAAAPGDSGSSGTGLSSATEPATTGDDDTGTPPGPSACVPGQALCGTAELLTCNADGTAWDTVSCEQGQVCLDATCIDATLTVTTEVLAAATLGFDYAAQLEASGGTTPYAWSVGSGEVPAGLDLAADGELTGMPQVPGDYVFDASVMDTDGTTAQRSFSLTVHPEPLTIITVPGLGTFDEGESMNVPLTAVGGVPPYGWFVVDGALPQGLIFDASGAVTGTPLQPGPFDFRVRIVDAQEPPGFDEQDFSLDIDLRPLTVVGEQEYDLLAFKVVVLPLLAIIPGVPVPYSTQLMADGGLSPYTWSEEPLPAGLDAIITQAGIPNDLVLDADGMLSGSVTNTDQVITVPLLLAGIDLTGFFFYAEVADSQDPAATATALFVIPTLPVGA